MHEIIRFRKIGFTAVQNSCGIFTEQFYCYFWMEDVLTLFFTAGSYLDFLMVSLHVVFSPIHSEIQTLKRTVSSPLPATLDMGSHHTSNTAASSSSITTTTNTTSSTNPLSVVADQFDIHADSTSVLPFSFM